MCGVLLDLSLWRDGAELCGASSFPSGVKLFSGVVVLTWEHRALFISLC